MIKFEIINESGNRSWPDIDEKYGRVIAYQVKQDWSIKSSAAGVDNKVDSVADIFFDVDYKETDTIIDPASLLPIQDCSLPNHLKRMDPALKTQLLA